jgi:enolase
MSAIREVKARQILDSRGNPTLEVDVSLEDGVTSRAAVPSGASTGSRESTELRDTDARPYGGRGMLAAAARVREIIGPALVGADPLDQRAVDHKLCELDGTPGKARLGANAILGVSLAVARAAAASRGVPLYASLGGPEASTLPVPLLCMFNGGYHADNGIDFQELMIAPIGASSFSDAIRVGAETYHALKGLLKQRGHGTAIGDTGGFAPSGVGNDEAVELILRAIEAAGSKPGVDVSIAIDAAASVIFEAGAYVFRRSDHRHLSATEMVEFWSGWVQRYPILSIEDGLAEVDWKGWRLLTERLGDRVQLVGDDIFVTNPRILKRAIAERIGNATIIKPNQVGTLTEALEATEIAREAGYGTVVSHRSGDTPDDFIADLAVGTSAGQIKAGAPSRGERVAKYNRLLRIEEELGTRARYAQPASLLRLAQRSGGAR